MLSALTRLCRPAVIPEPRTTERRATSPSLMRCCGELGYHREGCGRLDQLDAGEKRSS